MKAKTVFLVADKYEINNIFRLKNYAIETKSIFPVYRDRSGKDCIVECGIGKSNAAGATQFVLDVLKPARIINIGIAGALDKNLPIGEIYRVECVRFFDVDASAFGYQWGQIPKTDVYEYLISASTNHVKTSVGVLTGDAFVKSKDAIDGLRPDKKYRMVDMELGSIAHICHRHGKLNILSAYKAPSDYADGKARDDYYKNEKRAFRSLKVLISKITKE